MSEGIETEPVVLAGDVETGPALPPRDPELNLGTLTIHGDRSKLFSALAKAQKNYDPIKRSRTVQVRSDKGNYTFDYAPLEEVISATLPHLNNEGLAWISMLADGDHAGEADLHTLLAHESGAFMHVVESLPPVPKAQERGSQITYRRRYQYQCLTGTSPEVDDDGNAADGNRVEGVSAKRQTPPAPKPQEKPAPKEAPKDTTVDAPVVPLTEETGNLLTTYLKALGYKGPAASIRCREATGASPETIRGNEALGGVFLKALKVEAAQKGVTV